MSFLFPQITFDLLSDEENDKNLLLSYNYNVYNNFDDDIIFNNNKSYFDDLKLNYTDVYYNSVFNRCTLWEYRNLIYNLKLQGSGRLFTMYLDETDKNNKLSIYKFDRCPLNYDNNNNCSKYNNNILYTSEIISSSPISNSISTRIISYSQNTSTISNNYLLHNSCIDYDDDISFSNFYYYFIAQINRKFSFITSNCYNRNVSEGRKQENKTFLDMSNMMLLANGYWDYFTFNNTNNIIFIGKFQLPWSCFFAKYYRQNNDSNCDEDFPIFLPDVYNFFNTNLSFKRIVLFNKIYNYFIMSISFSKEKSIISLYDNKSRFDYFKRMKDTIF